ncbi:MAG: hypothetical protein JO309_07665 [Pseudonocardiales bacterium]|nr:hypothetical protein [Pseudonocardiales bacterium]MBV9729265.1 hypothetical protein [Pseudonocardiales bacterium]
MIGALGGCGHGASTAPGASTAGASAARGSAPAPAAPTAHTISITVRGGKASGDTGRITVPLGTPLVVAVNSDVADEIYVHGYDRKARVPAGTTGAVTFTANVPGVFEVELEGSKLQPLQLQVGL